MRSYRPNRWIFRERFFSGTKFVKKAWKIPFSKETTRTRDHASRDRLAVTISSCATVFFFFLAPLNFPRSFSWTRGRRELSLIHI